MVVEQKRKANNTVAVVVTVAEVACFIEALQENSDCTNCTLSHHNSLRTAVYEYLKNIKLKIIKNH